MAEYVVVDGGCNVLWCGCDRTRADEVADQIEADHGRAVVVRERLDTDTVADTVRE